MYIKNTAGQSLGFRLIDSSGVGVTAATVIAKRSIDMAGDTNATGTVTELGGGHYCLNMSQADTNGDNITFYFTAYPALPVEKTITTGGSSPIVTAGTGIHFNTPKEFLPYTANVANLYVYDSGGSPLNSTTTGFFTEMARRGLQDNTNWTADTYKTILSIPAGSGLVAAYVGCTAGGSETHTVEFTVDGVTSTMTITGLTSGQRAFLTCEIRDPLDYTTAAEWTLSGSESLASDKATFTGFVNNSHVPVWHNNSHIPMLKFNESLLIRAKHSTNINNSTATAYSAVMYRQFLQA